jgi:hypothetical protein
MLEAVLPKILSFGFDFAILTGLTFCAEEE